MYQYVEGAKFIQNLQKLDWKIGYDQLTIGEQLAQELLTATKIRSVNFNGNEIVKGNTFPVVYDEAQLNNSIIQLLVLNGQISIYGPQLNFQVIDHQFQYIQNEAFQNRYNMTSGTISFDDRQRIILNSEQLVTGMWSCASLLNLPKNQQFINCLLKFINTQKGNKRIKFTKQDSFILVNFDVSPTCILVSLGDPTLKLIYKQKVYRLWENFLNKNSFSSDLQFSINEYDQLENQISTLQQEYSSMLKVLSEPSTQLIDSVPNKTSLLILSKSNHQTNNHNSIMSHQFQGLLQVSSQKLFTGRSHLDTKRGYYLSAGQLSENSFLQDIPLINQINQ
ncbi:unnamed protein product (macronuclear) [Paramecium tetraurelia]|uniref:Uncharacterized protein n=1 Tax=Paramecium tetraurelia TaxID=5888 RepID=A0BEQ4_PARTE|nr:uncharacterized protein GSPATT00028054001 [Paramecium tetraurelia]CAK57021.1 unnamed protein product [Paramecium tetraurelia]|eukprot:XP_001424419.1 hypothetical protein (macronuclear) [Paramecium tetraurelia strain d4-2]